MRISLVTAVACLSIFTVSAAEIAAAAVRQETHIPAQGLGAALERFARERNLQLVYASDEVEKLRSRQVSGNLRADEALAQLLKGTGLRYRFLDEQTVTVQAAAGTAETASSRSGAMERGRPASHEQLRLARVSEEQKSAPAPAAKERDTVEPEGSTRGIPEILVKGSRSANTDIRRTEDDVQPYVVFEAEEIKRAMVPDLETFLRTRLPMNQSVSSFSQDVTGTQGNQSSIDLRGLGAEETLVLVDGRRMAGVASGDIGQPDINGIPLGAVERIEILPSTAGGIYGGGATGGVVNIILKHDYSGLQIDTRYDGSFVGGGSRRHIEAMGGFALEGGRTRVMVTAGYRDGKPLYMGDRDFAIRARRLQEKNYPESFALHRPPLVSVTTWPIHGYTTNIKSVTGNDLVLKSGMHSLSSNIAHVPVGYEGWQSDDGAAFLDTAGSYNLELANDLQGRRYSLLNSPAVRSFIFDARREFTKRIDGFLSASRFDNRAVRYGSSVLVGDNVVLPAGENSPFTEDVMLSIPFPGYELTTRTHSRHLRQGINGGLIVRLPGGWMVHGEYGLSESEHRYSYPGQLLNEEGEQILTGGQFQPLRDVNVYPLDVSGLYPDRSGLRDYDRGRLPVSFENSVLRVAGPLLQIPAGQLRLAAHVGESRSNTGDRVRVYYDLDDVAPRYVYYPEIGKLTRSAYAELTAPLVAAANARPGLQSLELMASYRYDTIRTSTHKVLDSLMDMPSANGPFPDLPTQINEVNGNQYTFGLRYAPVESIALRMSYGRGVLPPRPSQLSEFTLVPFAVVSARLLDPKRGYALITGATLEEYSVLGTLDLRPEISESLSAGFIFTPRFLPGLRMTVDYTRIEKVDEIGTVAGQTLLDNGDSFPGSIVRAPLTAADEALGYTGGVITRLHRGRVNIAHSLVEAVDINADYDWVARFGAFKANIRASFQPRSLQQITQENAEINTVGLSQGPLKWRIMAGLDFSRGAWNLGWRMQYYSSRKIYNDILGGAVEVEVQRQELIHGQGSAQVGSQNYHDVYAGYSFDGASGFGWGLLNNSELRASVQNVLNTSPPFWRTMAIVSLGLPATPRRAMRGCGATRSGSPSVSRMSGAGGLVHFGADYRGILCVSLLALSLRPVPMVSSGQCWAGQGGFANPALSAILVGAAAHILLVEDNPQEVELSSG